MKSVEMAKYDLTSSELNLIPYSKNEEIRFVHSNGYEFDMTVTEAATRYREESWGTNWNDCPRIYNSIQERSVTLKSVYPNLYFHFYISSNVPVDSSKVHSDSISIKLMKINFNNHYDITIGYDSLANFICNDSLTNCYDSIRISGKLYTSVIEKQIVNSKDSSALYPKSILFNKKGLIQLKLSNNETYSIKN